MATVAHLGGRHIKFTIGSTNLEFEIISGSVSDTAEQEIFLPVGRRICNVVTHARQITYQFTGVLLVDWMPWAEYSTSSPNYSSDGALPYTTVGLTPGMEVTSLYVYLNRNGTQIGPGDDPLDYIDPVYHYSAYAQVISMEHVFDTSTHQVFNVKLMADGSYWEPQFLQGT